MNKRFSSIAASVLFLIAGVVPAIAQPPAPQNKLEPWQTDWKLYVAELGKDLRKGIDPGDDARLKGKTVELEGTLRKAFDTAKPDEPLDIEMDEVAQRDFLSHLAGKWMLESEALGEGFIGSTLPSETSPPHEIELTEQTISFTADLQTGQGQYGQPIKETFTFTLEKAGENYLLSADSKSWLNLKQQKLSADATGAKGETKVSLDGTEMTLNISIELTPPSGQMGFRLEESLRKTSAMVQAHVQTSYEEIALCT